MAVLQIVSSQSGVGKTSVAAALVVIANAAGKQAAYYKPFSWEKDADPDAAFVSNLLQSSSGGPTVPVPGSRPRSVTKKLLAEMQAQITDLKSKASVVIVERHDTPKPYDLDCKILLVDGYSQQGDALSKTIAAAGPNLAGVVVNSVPTHRRDETARDLAVQPVPVAVIPESRGMLAVTVEQLAEHLGGEWVLDPVSTDAPVERFIIGGNILDAGPTYFGRYSNQAVITRVERPDIQMACMGEKTSCLVLTGPGEPTEYIKAEALQREVPLIQVRSNTLDTAEALAGLLDQADSRTNAKASHFAGLLEKYMGAEAVGLLLS